ncbi:MAG: TolC family protein [Bryobacteraceae bacterium]|nr:TolC family protein [Bryobacteraceae bacterium]
MTTKHQRFSLTVRCAMLLWSLGLMAHAQDPAPPAETLTVDQAVSNALQRNPSLRTAELDVEKSSDNLAAFRTRRLPSLKWTTLAGQLLTKPTVTFDQGVFGTYPGVGPIPGQETKVNIPRKPTAFLYGQMLQPLSQQYRLGLGVKLLTLERLLEEAKLAERRAAVAEQVRKAYYRLLETQSALESVEQSLPLYRETFRLAKVGLKLETVLESQQLKAEADVAKVELEALKLRNPIATQMEVLNELMGRPVNTPFRTVGVSHLVEESLDPGEAIRMALNRRPEVQQASLRVRQADLDIRVKKSEYIPDVSLALTYGSAYNFQNALPQNVATAGVYLEWEVFDWGRKKREMSAKRHIASQARIAEEALDRRIRVEVGQALRQCAEAAQRVKVSTLTQRAAREGLREQQSAFGREAVLLKDVLQSQTVLAAADDEQRRALAAYWSARAELKRVLGEQ